MIPIQTRLNLANTETRTVKDGLIQTNYPSLIKNEIDLNLVYDRPNSFKQSSILGIKQLKKPNFLLEENQKSHFKIDFMPLVSLYIP